MRTRTITAGLLAALALTLTACDSGDDQADTKPSAKSPAPATSSAFLRPNAAQEKTLIDGLTAIDPGLTTNQDRAVRRSVDVCDDIRKGKDSKTVISNAAYRYDGGNASVDNAKAEKIVRVIKDAYCKS
jgi:ABC-type oligopeptide transport system substrate-binding subunit